MEKLQEKIALEYEEFKKNIMKQKPEKIWDGCCKIYFYSSLLSILPIMKRFPIMWWKS